MTNLELNDLNVTELTLDEVKQTNGGSLFITIGVITVAAVMTGVIIWKWPSRK